MENFSICNFPFTILLFFCVALCPIFVQAEEERRVEPPALSGQQSEKLTAGGESLTATEETSPERAHNMRDWNNRTVPYMSRLFVWVGFIISIGLSAKLLTSFSDNNIGLLSVIFVGCIGALTSMIVLPRLYVGEEFQPVSLLGFALAVFVAFFILLFYGRILKFLGFSRASE